MITLAEFLLDRISEDEAVARLVRADSPCETDAPTLYAARPWGQDGLVVAVDYQRVLAQCTALRTVVNLHKPSDQFPAYSSIHGLRPTCTACVSLHADMDCENEHWPCLTLRALSAAYAADPGYREEWKP